jgi:putative chitobiose transport system permease protein
MSTAHSQLNAAAVTVPTGRAERGKPHATSIRSRGRTALSAIIAVLFILPAAWIVLDSFRPNEDVLSSLSPASWSLIIPSRLTLDNYVQLLTADGFGQALANSAIVCVVSVAIGVVISAMAGYALGVLNFFGRNAIFAVIVITFMVPFEAIAIPLSQLFTSWGLANTLIGLILPGIGNGLAIFNLRQHFLGIPGSFREAAKLDGASEPRILFSLYFRMSGSAITNSALLIFLGQWTAFLWPLILITNPNLQLAPVTLANTFGEYGAQYGQNFAGAVLLALIPAVIMFILQRFFGRLSIASGEK